jgi:hypothetical protein
VVTIYFVVPCGAAKLDWAAPARVLYTGSMFRHVLRAAEGEAAATERDLGVDAEVLILSALHGLVRLDEVLEPYDVKMGDPGSITVEALAAQVPQVGMKWRDEVYAMLPKAYCARLTEAAYLADYINVQDVYEAAPGIGYQRGVASDLLRHQGPAA